MTDEQEDQYPIEEQIDGSAVVDLPPVDDELQPDGSAIIDLEDGKGRTGYEAYLGERGVKLSGGQRQRIALARAILKDAPILVLDEATSSVDSESEQLLQKTTREITEGRSALVIAHRLDTVRHADRILVLERGRLVEEGDHESLLHKEGRYAQFVNLQLSSKAAKDLLV